MARVGIQSGQAPFGSVIVKGDQTVAMMHNTVGRDMDPTAHAEVNAIRQACGRLDRLDLSGAILYTTCEPCPMCLTAILWSGLDRVVYGATIADAEASGFRQFHVGADELAQRGGGRLVVESGPLRDECITLFTEWRERSSKEG
jgi:tRNA(Arg) A34 adenosine deaminase TadA